MGLRRNKTRSGYTLIEVVLVVGLLMVISALTIPNFVRRYRREALPGSARQLRSLITLVRANAAFDGKRFRIRFPKTGEADPLGGDRQPLIEREDDPIGLPDEFHLVTAPWAVGETLLGEVWCPEVRPGRPTVEGLRSLRESRSTIEEVLQESFDEKEGFEAELPPLMIEPDGSSEWATFVLTEEAPRGIDLESLVDYARMELIVEGETGLAWLQRPFYDEELDLFEEKGWPVVLRQDFVTPRMLTENDVLELRDVPSSARETTGPADGAPTP